MGALKDFWNSATTRAIAIFSIIGLFFVYLIRSWQKSGADKSIRQDRIRTLDEFAKKREEVAENSAEEVAALDAKLQRTLEDIETRAQELRADADHSRKRLADAINRSFDK